MINLKKEKKKMSALYLFAGTIFLWIFWPSFNAALATPGAEQQRAVVNTVLSISASTVTAFAVSFIVSGERKLEMVIAFFLDIF